MDKIFVHERALIKYSMEVLSDVPGIKIIGPPVEDRGGIISFVVDKIHPHDVAQILDEFGIAVRAGHHCAMPLHEKLHLVASTRASLYLYNTKDDIDELKKGLLHVQKVFE